MTISSLRADMEGLLARLPSEIHLDLRDGSHRFSREPSIREKVVDLLGDNPERERILQELFGCGPLTPLLENPLVTEIIVNGHDSIWYEENGQFFPLTDHFLSPFTLSQFVQLICLEARLRLDLNQPFADGCWRGFRVHLAQSPLVHVPHTLCLRKHPRASWRLDQLVDQGWAERSDLALLRQLIDERKNMLIIGPTGSGKTSVLSALLAEVPATERVVIIEDTSEIHPPNAFCTKLLTRVDSQGILRNFDQSELVRQSLRMRPSRLVVGEVRGPEAKDLLLALSTGHSGSLGTLHAFSARQALLRLEMLVQMGAPDWSLDTVRQLIRLSLQVVVVVSQQDGRRYLEGIHKICALEKVGFLLEKMKGPSESLDRRAINI